MADSESGIQYTTDNKLVPVDEQYITNLNWLKFWSPECESHDDFNIEKDETIFCFWHLVFEFLPTNKKFNEQLHLELINAKWDTLEENEKKKLLIDYKQDIMTKLNSQLLKAFGWKNSDKFKSWSHECDTFDVQNTIENEISYVLFCFISFCFFISYFFIFLFFIFIFFFCFIFFFWCQFSW